MTTPQLTLQRLQGAQGADQGHHAVEAAFSQAVGIGDRPSMPGAQHALGSGGGTTLPTTAWRPFPPNSEAG